MAIWTLIQDGTMSLDDNPQKYLSFWTNDTSDPRSKVKLSQLLSFTSGFNGEYNCTPLANFDDCVQRIYSDGLYHIPGTTYHYAGDHLQVAGLMAVKASGYSTWIDLFNARIKVPTGAQGSVVYTPAGSTNSRIAGGLLTSTNTYIQMLMGFYMPTLFNATTLALMQQDRTASPVVIESRPPGVEEIGQDWHYCGSFWYECPLPTFNSTCANQKVFSSPGAFGFTPSVDRVNDYWMVVSQNQVQGAPDAVFWTTANRDKIVRVLNQLYPPPVASPAAAPVAAAAPVVAPAPSNSSPVSNGNAPTSSVGNSPSVTSTPKASAASVLLVGLPTLFSAFITILSFIFM
jgi:CubicO group peptidase (beta-lactamase class C family)